MTDEEFYNRLYSHWRRLPGDRVLVVTKRLYNFVLCVGRFGDRVGFDDQF